MSLACSIRVASFLRYAMFRLSVDRRIHETLSEEGSCGDGIAVAFCPDADNLSRQVRSGEGFDRRYLLRNGLAADDTNADCGVSLADLQQCGPTFIKRTG